MLPEIKPSYNILTQLENIMPVRMDIPTLCVGELYVPDEIVRVILNKINTYIAAKSCCLVSLKMHQLAVTILLPKLLIFQNFGFSPLSWNKHCTKTPVPETTVDEAFQALPDIQEKLKSPSPVWKDKTRADTEILFYIPKHILGKHYTSCTTIMGDIRTTESIRIEEALTIENLKSSFCCYSHRNAIGERDHFLTFTPGWVLMSKEPLPDSLNKELYPQVPYETQVSQVHALNPANETIYQVAQVGEVLIGLYAEIYKTGNRLLENTATYCEEKVHPTDDEGMIVGHFVKKKYIHNPDLGPGPGINKASALASTCILYVERLNKK